jgi:hypothetical protein
MEYWKLPLGIAGAVLLLALIAAIVCWFLLRRLYRFLATNSGVFGATPQARLVALGASVILLPQMITGPIEAFLRVGQVLLPNAYLLWVPFVKLAGQQDVSTKLLFATTGESLGQAMSLLAKALSEANFPVTSFLIGIACWSFVGQLLGGGSSEKGVDWQALVHRLPAVTWKNVALFAVLFSGTYLSIASITAIPSLQRSETPIEADRARLVDQLKFSRLSKVDFDSTYQTPPDTQPFNQLKQRLGIAVTSAPPRAPAQGPAQTSESRAANASGPATMPASATGQQAAQSKQDKSSVAIPQSILRELSNVDPEFSSLVKGVQSEVLVEEQSRSEIRARLETLRTEVYQREDALQGHVPNVFDSGTVGHLAARERSRYIQTLDLEFQHQISLMESSLRSCVLSVRTLEEYWQYLANDLEQSLDHDTQTATRVANEKNSKDKTPRAYYETSFRLRSSSPARSVPTCENPTYPNFVSPTPPNAVDEWGAFRFFAGWLLRSESMPLAVITGMLGVGLLGAAASSFIRQQASRKKGDPLVEDLAGVVIRGFSAAIVIFLAVEGGLSIFGAGTGEPNSYVLLCTCLIGSVFSEDVWNKAHEWLEAKKQGDSGRNNGNEEQEDKKPNEHADEHKDGGELVKPALIENHPTSSENEEGTKDNNG